jgi:hypothetical protein
LGREQAAELHLGEVGRRGWDSSAFQFFDPSLPRAAGQVSVDVADRFEAGVEQLDGAVADVAEEDRSVGT